MCLWENISWNYFADGVQYPLDMHQTRWDFAAQEVEVVSTRTRSCIFFDDYEVYCYHLCVTYPARFKCKNGINFTVAGGFDRTFDKQAMAVSGASGASLGVVVGTIRRSVLSLN